MQQWLCTAEDINERKKRKISACPNRSHGCNSLAAKLSVGHLLWNNSGFRCDATSGCRIHQCRRKARSDIGRDLRHREIRFASAGIFPMCRLFFFYFPSCSLFSNREKASAKNCSQFARASKTYTRENVHRKNSTAKKYDSRLWKFVVSP